MREAVLIVDDESGVRASLAGILGDEGYAVQAVESGEACLAALEGRRFDLLLLDVWLPRMDGLETLGRVRALDPELPVPRVERLDDLLSGSLAPPRFRTAVLLAFALLALLLALVGIYGVTAYEVTRRTAEIGIRRALGAQTSAVVRLVIGRSLGLVLSGLAAGILASLAVTRVLEGFLFAVSPLDAGTFLVVALALTAAAALASAGPARRATRVDPAVALRCD